MKKLLFLLMLCFFSINLFSQENQIEENTKKESPIIFGERFQKPSNIKDFFAMSDFLFAFEPGVYINTQSSLVSAPSPVIYPITIGMLWPNKTFLAVQPTLSFFTMQYLWYNEMALPAEIENRTATALSFMINVPLVFTFYTQKSRFQLMPGVGFLFRAGLLSNNVNSSDSGYSGSAGSDLEKINQYFYQGGRFFYISAGFSWLYQIRQDLKAGPVINMYFPIVPLATGQGLLGTIFSIGMKVSL